MVYLHEVRETHWVRQNPLHFWQRSNYCTIRVPAQRTSQFIDLIYNNLQNNYILSGVCSPSYRLG